MPEVTPQAGLEYRCHAPVLADTPPCLQDTGRFSGPHGAPGRHRSAGNSPALVLDFTAVTPFVAPGLRGLLSEART